MNWDELYARGINVENISRNSKEFEVMFSAALQKVPSAQYCLGLWAGTVDEKPDVALLWLRKAAQQGLKEAIEAIRRIESEDSTGSASVAEEHTYETQVESAVSENNLPTLIIKEHDFQAAKNSLIKYTEQAQKNVELSRVPNKGGLWNLATHKVDGPELNKITSQIQNYLIQLNNLSQGIVDELGQVYKAFESLDRDYISGIVASIKTAEKVHRDEKKDRKDIKKLVEQHALSVAVLTKFKEDLDALKDLTNQEFNEYMADLSKVKHLKDVDVIYADLDKLKNNLVIVSNLQNEYTNTLSYVKKYCDTLSELQHIGDIDELWSITESATKEIQSIKESLKDHMQAIRDFRGVILQIREFQQQFVDTVNNTIFEFRGDIDKQVKAYTEAQEIKLIDIDRQYSEDVENLSIEQKAKLESIEKGFRNSLDSAVEKQSLAISEIHNTQKEKFEELLEYQSSTLEQIANDQSSKLGQIYQSLEEEKSILNEQVNALTHKVKLLYIVAGGAATLTAIQLLLNILGVC